MKTMILKKLSVWQLGKNNLAVLSFVASSLCGKGQGFTKFKYRREI
jgi:hypothetical protein